MARKSNPTKHIHDEVTRVLNSRDLKKEVKDLVDKKLSYEINNLANNIVYNALKGLQDEFVASESLRLKEQARGILRENKGQLDQLVESTVRSFDLEDRIYYIVESILEGEIEGRIADYLSQQFPLKAKEDE